ncbi:hypothetical protein [Actinophytocola sp. NPDC049390]|uniref:hypothetical protein n=1 Tax=Actinophytocola sp. NPDC049390 TaxID=3363894 RepID=UPI00379BE396
MADRKIAPLIPPKLTCGAGHQRLAARNAHLDVVDLLAPPLTGSLVYGMVKIDTSGAVSNRSTVDALG